MLWIILFWNSFDLAESSLKLLTSASAIFSICTKVESICKIVVGHKTSELTIIDDLETFIALLRIFIFYYKIHKYLFGSKFYGSSERKFGIYSVCKKLTLHVDMLSSVRKPQPLVTGISPKEGPPGTKVKIRGENLGVNAKDIIGNKIYLIFLFHVLRLCISCYRSSNLWSRLFADYWMGFSKQDWS